MAITTETSPMRNHKRLGILVAADLHHAADGAAIELQLDLVRHPHCHRLLAEPDDGAVHAARRYHAVALLERAQHLLALRLLALLRAQHDEVQDREPQRDTKGELQTDPAARAAA